MPGNNSKYTQEIREQTKAILCNPLILYRHTDIILKKGDVRNDYRKTT